MNKFIALTALTAANVSAKLFSDLKMPIVAADENTQTVNLDNYDGATITLTGDMKLTLTTHENEDGGFEWEILENTCGSKLKLFFDDFVIPEQEPDAEGEFDSGVEGIRTWMLKTPTEYQINKYGLTFDGSNSCNIKMVWKEAWEKPAADDKYQTINFVY